MQSGKLGVAVIMLAIVGTIIAAYVISMDVEEREVIRYNPLVDLTTEFDRESTPEYVTYSPSTNYTGYYTDSSVIAGTQYFDGVEFGESSGANNYRLNLTPDYHAEGDVSLTGLTKSGDVRVNYWPTAMRNNWAQVDYIRITDLLQQKSWEGDQIFIISDQGSFTDMGFFTFYGKPFDRNILMKNPEITDTYVRYYDQPGDNYLMFDASNLDVPILACVYHSDTRLCELYYDTELQRSAGVSSYSDTVILYGSMFGTSGDYEIYDFPPPAYMDPSKGVELE